MCHCDPVGIPELVARLGLTRSALNQWRQRSLGFPEPTWTIGGRPAWNWPDVEAWYEARPHRLAAVNQDPTT